MSSLKIATNSIAPVQSKLSLAIRILLIAAALTPLISLQACHRHSRGRRDGQAVVSELNYFSLDADYFDGNRTDHFEFEASFPDFRMEFRVRHFEFGACRVRVYDADGVTVLDNEYYVDIFHKGEEEYIDIDVTDVGEAGIWTVRLDYEDFDGHLYLILD